MSRQSIIILEESMSSSDEGISFEKDKADSESKINNNRNNNNNDKNNGDGNSSRFQTYQAALEDDLLNLAKTTSNFKEYYKNRNKNQIRVD